MTNIDIIYNHFLEYRQICTDSRRITQNCIFFALNGERFNGNLFAVEALSKGADFAIIDQDIDTVDNRLIRVPNVLTFLQELSTKHRLNFQIPVIAITGSNGKTTTKELIAKVLSADFNIHFTQGNFNNHIGVPLTLLQITKHHEIAIIEMGANHQREIAALCEIARPTHGLITNIGKAHLEGFGGIEGVKIGKGELFDYLGSHGGIVFANKSEKSLTELFEKKGLTKVSYSNQSKEDGFINVIDIHDGNPLSFEVEFHNQFQTKIVSQVQGEYNLANMVNAICIGTYFRVSPEKIKERIESYSPQNNRSQLKSVGSNHFILDAYNANPTSMIAALENFSKLDHPQKIAILGEMLELGDYSDMEHKAIKHKAAKLNLQKVIFVGSNFAESDFSDVDSLKEWFDSQNFKNTYFLLKGSRGVGLEKLVNN